VTTIYDVARVAGVSTADALDAEARQVAFEQAVAATPDSGIDQVIHGDFSQDSGVAAARLPADVAVTGFDDLYPSRIIDPPLTTVSQPIHELGRRATHRLMARIASPGLAPRAETLPTQVVIRTSCGCPATAGRERAAQRPAAAEPQKTAWDGT
jgi:Periplasmic binding protein-like domain